MALYAFARQSPAVMHEPQATIQRSSASEPARRGEIRASRSFPRAFDRPRRSGSEARARWRAAFAALDFGPVAMKAFSTSSGGRRLGSASRAFLPNPLKTSSSAWRRGRHELRPAAQQSESPAALKSYFPKEAVAIDRYLELVRSVSNALSRKAPSDRAIIAAQLAYAVSGLPIADR
jgi:hypothetical protein